MKIVYFDLGMGAAGDMIAASLLGLFDDPDAVCDELNALEIPGIRYVLQREAKRGICGLHLRVEVDGAVEGELSSEHDCLCGEAHHDSRVHRDGRARHHKGARHHEHHAHHHHEYHHHHEHHAQRHEAHVHERHANLASIEAVIDGLALDRAVQDDARAIFRSIAQAESTVHGQNIDQIHFHEVGTMDAVADVVAASVLISKLAPDRIYASPVCTGVGTVACTHGILPVPTPATALLLQGIPAYGGTIEGELCTPTGAAIIRHFVEQFISMPTMKMRSIGYGIGTKDFPRANCLRVILGDVDEFGDRGAVDRIQEEGAAKEVDGSQDRSLHHERLVELVCTIDDMTGESLGFALQQLLEAGALDAYIAPVIMKKSRPGSMLCVLCDPSSEVTLLNRLLTLTSTLGVRRYECDRYFVDRHIEAHETSLGVFRVKEHIKGNIEGGVKGRKIEYDDLARLARERGISLDDARVMVEQEIR